MSSLEDEINLRTGLGVKRRRESAGMSLRALAARSAVSPSMISDIERGTKSPTVATLARLAQALGVPPAALLEDAAAAPSRIRVLRQAEAPTGDTPAPWRHLAPAGPASRVDFIRLVIPPAAALPPSPGHAAGTIEHLHLASGTLRVTVGDETATLQPGDSCTCRTDVPHDVANTHETDEAVVYLIQERA